MQLAERGAVLAAHARDQLLEVLGRPNPGDGTGTPDSGDRELLGFGEKLVHLPSPYPFGG